MSFWAPWTHLYGYSQQPGVWIPVIVCGFLYWRGRRQITNSGRPGDPVIGVWRAVALYVSLALAVFDLEGPINYLAYDLFWVHMVEHCVLQMVVALLLLVGAPWLPLWRGLPERWRQAIAPTAKRLLLRSFPIAVGQMLRRPWVGLAAMAATFWTWHLPYVFDHALHSAPLHDIEFFTLLVGGLVFWSQTVDSYPLRRQLATWPLAGYLVAGTAIMWVVAVSLGLSVHAWYAPYYDLAARPGGISALTDQQWGAGVAWVPAAIPAEIMLDIAVLQWLRDDERKADAEAELYLNSKAPLQESASPKDP